MGDTIFDILKLLEGLVPDSVLQSNGKFGNILTIGKGGSLYFLGSEGLNN